MGKTVEVTPSWFGVLAFLGGSDHYSVRHALTRAPVAIPVDGVSKVYEIEAKPLVGIGGSAKFAIEYKSELRDCFVSLE